MSWRHHDASGEIVDEFGHNSWHVVSGSIVLLVSSRYTIHPCLLCWWVPSTMHCRPPGSWYSRTSSNPRHSAMAPLAEAQKAREPLPNVPTGVPSVPAKKEMQTNWTPGIVQVGMQCMSVCMFACHVWREWKTKMQHVCHVPHAVVYNRNCWFMYLS